MLAFFLAILFLYLFGRSAARTPYHWTYTPTRDVTPTTQQGFVSVSRFGDPQFPRSRLPPQGAGHPTDTTVFFFGGGMNLGEFWGYNVSTRVFTFLNTDPATTVQETNYKWGRVSPLPMYPGARHSNFFMSIGGDRFRIFSGWGYSTNSSFPAGQLQDVWDVDVGPYIRGEDLSTNPPVWTFRSVSHDSDMWIDVEESVTTEPLWPSGRNYVSYWGVAPDFYTIGHTGASDSRLWKFNDIDSKWTIEDDPASWQGRWGYHRSNWVTHDNTRLWLLTASPTNVPGELWYWNIPTSEWVMQYLAESRFANPNATAGPVHPGGFDQPFGVVVGVEGDGVEYLLHFAGNAFPVSGTTSKISVAEMWKYDIEAVQWEYLPMTLDEHERYVATSRYSGMDQVWGKRSRGLVAYVKSLRKVVLMFTGPSTSADIWEMELPCLKPCGEWPCADGKYGCSGHGSCPEKDAECVCDPGWGDPSCATIRCEDGNLNTSACSGQGTCHEPNGTCVCDQPTLYGGQYCSDFYCEDGELSKDRDNVCKGHGTCASVSLPKCLCQEKWGGLYCAVAEAAGSGGAVAAGILIPLFLLIIVVLVVVVVVVYFWYRRRFQKQEKDTVAQFLAMEEEKMAADLKIDESLFVIEYSDLEVKESLGKGGSNAMIFLVVWEGREVAFKVFRLTDLSLSADQQGLQEFEREVQMLGSLSHPHILSFYGAILSPPRIGIVMEYCPHGDLKDYATSGDITMQERLRLLEQTSAAIAFLHRKSVIHRDLKPENILVSAMREAKVCDFGLSRKVTPDDQAKTTHIGTAVYMAPELLTSIEYDEKVDVFAFGLMLFTVLSGNYSPYGALAHPQVKVAADPFFRPNVGQESFDGMKRELTWVIKLMMKCWECEPGDRPSFDEISLEFVTNGIVSKTQKTGEEKEGSQEEEEEAAESQQEAREGEGESE